MQLINATVRRCVLIVGFNDVLPRPADISYCRLFDGEEGGGVATEEGGHRHQGRGGGRRRDRG
ncbi:hypothetical protein ACLOJK_033804 [Asimina triloba]